MKHDEAEREMCDFDLAPTPTFGDKNQLATVRFTGHFLSKPVN